MRVLDYTRRDAWKASGAGLLLVLTPLAIELGIKPEGNPALHLAMWVAAAWGGWLVLWTLRIALSPHKSPALRRLHKRPNIDAVIQEIDRELEEDGTVVWSTIRITRNWLVVFQMGATVIPLEEIVGITKQSRVSHGRKIHSIQVYTSDGCSEHFGCRNELAALGVVAQVILKSPGALTDDDLPRRWIKERDSVINEVLVQRKKMRTMLKEQEKQ